MTLRLDSIVSSQILLGCTVYKVNIFPVNLLPTLDSVEADDPDLDAWEKGAVEYHQSRFNTPTSGAAIMNSTRPATIGAILSSSPLAYLAW
jgi:hypothetical protein